jgi:hypothetical protein
MDIIVLLRGICGPVAALIDAQDMQRLSAENPDISRRTAQNAPRGAVRRGRTQQLDDTA